MSGSAAFEVKLEVFEGPFQLLLSLISDQRVDVCDIPIARLTEEYLARIERMERADLEITTEFLVVAATLVALKAKALLPETGVQSDGEDDIERDLLIARLLEVRAFQQAGSYLADQLRTGDQRFPSAPAPDDDALRKLPSLGEISAADLARLLVEVVRDTMRSVDTSKVVVDQVSTEEAAEELVRTLERGEVTFREVASGRGLPWAVALFLAMLELAMRGVISLGEGATVGEIRLSLPGGAA